ncbi:transposase [Chryseobacterium potabilaquae]|uniref:Uncharacterized protein n=1 Tax=Chryseobacterium potabilaquae TaxID=2675057 RepID=A0A6N4XDJ0_9FLAO|nr:transposase [Chryseobacterium potabilaquae]CAA7197065.1 hypothetical protein CHRY9293_03122 [Chryseobacterium potabilaquae]
MNIKKNNFKNFHIGSLIEQKGKEVEIEATRICDTFNCKKEELQKMYESEGLELEFLLIWSKLLNYDFSRIYSQHIVLYVPQIITPEKFSKKRHLKSLKNIYTNGIIDFILKMLFTGEKIRYRLPESMVFLKVLCIKG